MKNILKIGALAGSLFAATVANAGIITVTHNATLADEANLQTLMNTFITEDFDTIGDITCVASCSPASADFVLAAPAFDTKVGTFTQVQADGTGSEPAGQLDQLQIENGGSGEFGRETPFASNWLDSNDSDQIVWDIDAGFRVNAFGFFLSDANDQGAVLTLTLDNGTTVSASLNANLGNGNLAYVRYVGNPLDNIIGATLTFDNGSDNNDGFGIDNVTLGTVSAPHTILLLSLSILGLIALRKRA
ncbi:hypothetical protein KJ365_07075 [Glaciecola sp. XM2]|uniref:hypothetical protein n=1 Tax=Glaciecola sp. XM2 TaxID=1914931 RepID=UPI001BDEE058|nr:hypothetical protein [Glaciecola sp. XM2]MBT1450642.1 hypothetical protein [Glaciecola sp. XM2]